MLFYYSHKSAAKVHKNMEMPGIEPGAFHMQSERSTTELHPHLWIGATYCIYIVGSFDSCFMDLVWWKRCTHVASCCLLGTTASVVTQETNLEVLIPERGLCKYSAVSL